MQKYMFPALIVIIIYILFSCFKPRAFITYTDIHYLDNLQNCRPYTASGKIFLFGNTNSISTIKGYKNGKCLVETENTFSFGPALATFCELNPNQLKELKAARESSTYAIRGYTDELLVKKYIKEGSCKSYKLKDNKWVQDKI